MAMTPEQYFNLRLICRDKDGTKLAREACDALTHFHRGAMEGMIAANYASIGAPIFCMNKIAKTSEEFWEKFLLHMAEERKAGTAQTTMLAGLLKNFAGTKQACAKAE